MSSRKLSSPAETIDNSPAEGAPSFDEKQATVALVNSLLRGHRASHQFSDREGNNITVARLIEAAVTEYRVTIFGHSLFIVSAAGDAVTGRASSDFMIRQDAGRIDIAISKSSAKQSEDPELVEARADEVRWLIGRLGSAVSA